MPPLIDKLLFMTDRYQSEPAGYSPSASQEACKALLYCTYNVKSAQPLVDCGALGKMVNITKSLDKDNDTPLRWEDILQICHLIFMVNQNLCNQCLSYCRVYTYMYVDQITPSH